MSEVWKPIKGYDGIYEVSSLGRVRLLDRVGIRKDGSPYRWKGHLLKPKTYSRHYSKVRLVIKGESDRELHVHRLVAEAFIPNPDNLPHVRHKNGDIYDNRADNLEWCEQGNVSQSEDGEQWKPVVGYEGKYEVSNHGRVRSVDHIVTHPNSQNGEDAEYLHHGRILKQITNPKGYYMVGINDHDGIHRLKPVHQLVARAWVPGWYEGAIVNHKDECKTNNRPDNLEWCDYQHNNTWGSRIRQVQERFIASGHARPICQYDMQGNFIQEFESVQEASRVTGLNRNSINQCLWGNCKHAKKFIFKYKQ